MIAKQILAAYFLQIVCLFFISNSFIKGQGSGQSSSNPINHLLFEYNQLNHHNDFPIYVIRTFYWTKESPSLNVSYSSVNYYNTGFTNLHNNGELIAYPLLSNYISYSLSYLGNFLYFKFSPLLQKINDHDLDSKLNGNSSYLNDKQADIIIKENLNYLRQSTIAFH